MDKHKFSDKNGKEIKNAEKALRESEERYRALINNTSAVILRLDPQGIICFVNKRALDLFGFTEDEFVGKPALGTFIPELETSGRNLAEMVKEIAANPDRFHNNAHENICKDGRRVWMEWTNSGIYDDKGCLKEILSVGIDVTDRKQAEKALRESEERQVFLLKLSDKIRPLSNPIDIQAAVTQTAIDYYSADRCYYCEIENDKAIIKRDAFRGNLPSVAGVYPLNSLPIQKSLIYEGKPFVVNDVNTTDIDEELRQLYIQLKVISYIDVPVVKEGKPVGLLCVVQSNPRCWTDADVEVAVEISERAWQAVERARTAEALLIAEREKNEALQKSIEMKDEFLSLISHEFKTPITVINSAIQAMSLICKDELSDKANEFLRKILQNSNRQLKLVNNLLDISGINAGHIKTKRINVDIVKMTRLITESIMVFADQKDIRLLFSSTLKEKIIGIDDEKYERVLLNLLSNAIKFTSKGKSISVRVSQKFVNGRSKVRIHVKDQGIGIPKDKLQLIFERFGQVDSTLSRQAEGTGIGLSLVKMFVEIMDGEIAVESNPGKGSTFTLLFPVAKIKETPIEKMLCDTNDIRLIQATAIEFSDIY